VFEYFCRDSIRARTFVVFKAFDGFVTLSEAERGIQMVDRGDVWEIYEYGWVGRVLGVEESIEMLSPSVQDL
jgi:hypothetical protein